MKRNRQITTLLTLLLLLPTLAWGQSSAITSLQGERKKAIAAVEKTNKLLSTHQKSLTSQLSQLRVLNSQIEQRTKLINLLNREVSAIEKQQRTLQGEINALEKELEEKKGQYAKAMRGLSTHRQGEETLLFLFSANSLSQGYRRMRYLQEYTNWRKKQAEEIVAKQEEIEQKLALLAQSKKEKEALLATRTQEAASLKAQKTEQQKLVNQLTKQKTALQKELNRKQAEANQLERKIDELIAEEARKAAEAARKAAEAEAARKAAASGKKPTPSASKPATSNGYTMTKAEKALSGSFEKNKGKLPMPISGYYLLVGKYGQHGYEGLKYVQVNSGGIDLQTLPNTDALAVFQGEVTRVFVMPGFNSSVIVRHGNYLTIYSNLSNVYVKSGDKVSARQPLGRIYTDKEDGNHTQLHFQLWKERTKQNPQLWLNM